MANIVDNLITNVQVNGVSEFISNFQRISAELRAINNAAIASNKLNNVNPSFNAKPVLNDLQLLQKAFTQTMGTALTFKTVMVAVGISIAAIFAGMAVKIAASMEVIQARLGMLYGNANGGEALGAYKQFVMKYGGTLEDAVNAGYQLEQAGGNITENKLRDLRALAFGMNTDMKSIANALALLAKGTSTGIGALGIKRLEGINMTDIRKQDPTAFDASGKNVINQQKALDAVYAIVEQRFGKEINNASKTTHSDIDKLKQSFANLMQTLGNAGIIQLFDVLVKAFTGLFLVLDKGLKILELFIIAIPTALAEAFGTRNIANFMAEKWQAIWKDFLNRNLFPKTNRFDNTNDSNNNQSAIVREILGGGAIAKIGIKPSELPGMAHARYRNTIHVDVNAGTQKLNEGIKEIAEKTINEGIRQGALKPQFGF